MPNFTDSNSAQQCEDLWLELTQDINFTPLPDSSLLSQNIDQDLTSLPYNPYTSTSDSITPTPFLTQRPISQPNDVHNSDLNYPSLSGASANHIPEDEEPFRYRNTTQNINVNSQPSFDLYAELPMSSASPKSDRLHDLAEPGEANSKTGLRCRFPDCSEDREFFTDSALRKHEGKHNKPYTCSVPACKHPQFGDKGGLDRHTREVHGTKTHCCPIPSCKRHTKGFPRKYNLFEHQKRCHSGQTFNTALRTVRPSQDQTGFQSPSMEGARDGDEEVCSSKTMVTGDLAGARSGMLHEKLQHLYALRVELDKDIETLKRAVAILG